MWVPLPPHVACFSKFRQRRKISRKVSASSNYRDFLSPRSPSIQPERNSTGQHTLQLLYKLIIAYTTKQKHNPSPQKNPKQNNRWHSCLLLAQRFLNIACVSQESMQDKLFRPSKPCHTLNPREQYYCSSCAFPSFKRFLTVMREDTRLKPNEGFLSHVPTLLFSHFPPKRLDIYF